MLNSFVQDPPSTNQTFGNGEEALTKGPKTKKRKTGDRGDKESARRHLNDATVSKWVIKDGKN